MNRTQRAMKRANRIAQNELKTEKRAFLDSIGECSFSLYGIKTKRAYADKLKAVSKEEKRLKVWRRQMIDACNNYKEVEPA